VDRLRGPGYSVSETTLRVLKRREYLYDASTWPTFIGPLARTYYFMASDLNKEDEEERRLLFGSFPDGPRRLGAYRWEINDEGLVAQPVTTFPILRVPMHVSCLPYLSPFSPWLARTYFRTAMWLRRGRGVQPTLLLHSLDVLGRKATEALAFFPAMKLRSGERIKQFDTCLQIFRRCSDVRTAGEHVRHVGEQGVLPFVKPRFPKASHYASASAASRYLP